MKKKKRTSVRNGLQGKILRVSVIPLLILEILALLVGVASFSNTMVQQVRKEMKSQCDMVLKIYDRKYPGNFNIQMNEDGTYRVLKGDTDITDDTSVIDDVKKSQNVDVTIFCKNIRVLTTIRGDDGKRVISTKAAEIIRQNVVKEKQDHFYNNVRIGSKMIYAYYRPILLKDGTVYGMIGIARPASDIKNSIWKAMIPIAVFWVAATILVALISIFFIKKLIGQLEAVRVFNGKVAAGDFTATVENHVLSQKDEIGDLARSGKKMQKALRQLVEYDPLTKLHNRRYAANRLKMAGEGRTEKSAPFCVAICDIDFFKKVNDTYGHDAGDVVLQGVAKLFMQTMKDNGFAARWGGEEFLLFFDNTQLKDAVVKMEEMLERLRHAVVPYKKEKIKVTLSIGITEATLEDSIEEILHRADDLLYQSKESGRDQVQWK